MKKVLSVLVVLLLLLNISSVSGNLQVAEAAGSTGVGLSAHCMTAYYEGWSYIYGACSYGYVDCSGLIYLYNHVGGIRADMLACSPEWGYVSNGIPRIHGLGLHSPGHVGVYVGSGMGVDARNEYYGVCYSEATSSRWNEWFKVSGVSYPNNGWVKFNGNAFYYEDGEYIVNTSRIIDGEKYTFGWSGAANKEPDSSAYLVTDYSSSTVRQTVSSSSSSSYSSSSLSSYTYTYDDSLSVGSSGDSVTKLQKRLIELGYFDDAATGYYGDMTKQAVSDFQKIAGLSVTGKADSTTRDTLYASSAPEKVKTYRIGDTSTEIIKIQKKLKSLQYFYEEATGYYGDITAVAVKQFQTDNDLKATGRADKDTQNALFASDVKRNPNAGSLSLGMISDKVARMKERLIELRYADDFTFPYSDEYGYNIFDKATLKALNRYQVRAGLEKSKMITADELVALYSDDAVKAKGYYNLQRGYKGTDVEELQRKLYALNLFHSEGGFSEEFGDDTEAAVFAFQRDFGLNPDGIATKAVVEAIDKEISKKEASVGRDVILKTQQVTTNALSNARMESSFEVVYLNSKDGTAQQIAWFILLLTFFAVCIVFVNCLKNGFTINKMINKKYYKLVVE